MFFSFRRYAGRVIEQMSLPIRSPEATELISMIVAGAKQTREMHRSVGIKQSDLELVLTSVAAMSDNNSATQRLCAELRIDESKARDILLRARAVGREMAVRANFTALVERFYDRLR